MPFGPGHKCADAASYIAQYLVLKAYNDKHSLVLISYKFHKKESLLHLFFFEKKLTAFKLPIGFRINIL